MPSVGRVQLNLSVEPEVRESLKRHCNKAGLSFAQAITEFVKACDRAGELIVSATPSDELVLDKIKELEDKISTNTSHSAIPDLDSQIDEKIQTAIAALKLELSPILDAQVELENLLEKCEA